MIHWRLHYFQKCLTTIPQSSYPLHSRVHPLRSFLFPHTTCYVKRDDELGFGISGSKIRKYRSLIPFFLNTGIQEVVVIGSAYSNHVLSIIQLLIENGLSSTLFLRGQPTRSKIGNSLLISLFVSPNSIHWFSKTEWPSVQSFADKYAQQQQHLTFVLPEGGGCAEALPGALTLCLDLLENEKERGQTFDHVFIEAGTGFMASALILGLSWLEHPTLVHVLVLAQNQVAFLGQLTRCHTMFSQWLDLPCPFPQNFVLHLPQISGNFGQHSTFLFERMSHLAREEGFLTDPIYTAKLFIETHHLLNQGEIKGNILIHHSGGALTLTGFQEQLQKTQKNPYLS